MNKQLIRKNKLSLSLALALGVGMTAFSGAAMAVALDGNDRLGDAGIYQYYTAQGGWQTFIRIINTSDQVASVKIRFREASNSREVLDFIVFMSPRDMWTAWTDDDATPGGAVTPGLRTGDTSCLFPVEGNTQKQGWVRVFPDDDDRANVLGADFSDIAFTGVYGDNGPATADRLGEGHIEVIGIAQHDPASDFGVAVTHNNGQQGGTGMPANCGTARTLWMAGDDGGEGAVDSGAVGIGMGNILGMNGYLINVSKGQGGGFDPDILTEFVGGEYECRYGYRCDWDQDEEGQDQSLQPLSRLSATDIDMDSATNYGFGANGSMKQKGRTMQPTQNWPGGPVPVTGGVDAVSYEFQRASVMNEWAASLNPGNIIRNYYTQWILTFPTKHYYVDLDNDPILSDDISPTLAESHTYRTNDSFDDAYPPFSYEYDWGGESCEPYRIRMWNREEAFHSWVSPEPDFGAYLCHETNVLVFSAEYVDQGLKSNFRSIVPVGEFPVEINNDPSERGWASVDFYDSANSTEVNWRVEQTRYINDPGSYPPPIGTPLEHPREVREDLAGLPVTGFLFSIFNTNNEETNHTTINAHKYRRDVFNGEPTVNLRRQP